MAAFESMIPTVGGEENVIAAAQHIVKVLGASKNLTADMRKILENLDVQLSAMAINSGKKAIGIPEIEEQLNSIQEKITLWESDHTMIWDSGPEAVSEYLQAVDNVRKLIESLESLNLNEDGKGTQLMCQSHSILQMAMARLEEEFSYILVQNRQPFELEHVSFRSSEDDMADGESTISIEDDSVDGLVRRDSSSGGSEEFITDSVHQDVIPDLKSIANVMFASNYQHECCQAYISARKEALENCLVTLEIEKLSIEEVLRMDWSSLNLKIKKWMRAMKIFIRIHLASEKRLCDQIFTEFGSVNTICFDQTSKNSMLQLLSFGEAIAVGSRKPEMLFRILDMYEVLSDLLPDMNTLYEDDASSCVVVDFHEVLSRLADSVRGTFQEFKNAIASDTSINPFAGGGIHPLTKYVMNYIKLLPDYTDTFNLLVGDDDHPMSLSPEENTNGSSSNCAILPMYHHLLSVSLILENNLDGKSKLYKAGPLRHIFLMNNIYYMVEKVKSSELRPFFGDSWIRQHNGKFQQHAMNYERATWSSILCLLKDEGLSNHGSNSVPKSILKERFKSFNLAFDEVYKNQTGWLIPDPQLREDLRISVSLKVIQAYRTFMGRYSFQLGGDHKYIDKYIKYSADDLQNFLLDLFEGSPKSLHNHRSR